MKRFFFLAIAAVGMTVACQKQEISNAPVDPMDNGTPVPVVFGTNVSSSVTTKAALDNWTGQESLVIYGFKTGADLSITDETDEAYGYLVNGLEVTSPASGTSGEVTIPNTFYGKEDSYDFYGYYAAGVDGDAVVAADKITVPVTITGQEDILVAKADKAKDIAKAKETYTGTIDNTRVYSAYSARRHVKPNLVFEHQLVRFDFELVNGSVLADGVTLNVKSIKIKANTTNNIVINKDGTCGLEGDGSVPADLEYELTGGETLEFTNATSANMPLNGNIMVMPGQTEYPLTLALQQTGSTEVESELTIKGEEFKAGYCYLVKVKVYAQEAVVLSVNLKDWLPGGTITLDPDEEESTYTAPVTTFQAIESWLVEDEATYNELPEFYKEKFPYEANKTNLTEGTDKLPWLAVTFTPATVLDVKVEKDGANVFTSNETYEEAKQLYTFCAREFGWSELEAGEYVVTINGVTFDTIVVE